jgi:hypothetical protein
MPADLRIVHEEPDFTLATLENTFLWCFRGDVSLDRIRRSRPVHRDLLARYPSGIAALTIICENVPLMMPADSRDAANAITKEFQPHYRGLATVILGTGFRGAAARAVISSINLFARVGCPNQVFEDPAGAGTWLARTAADPKRGVSLAGLSDAAVRVRRGP